MIGLPSTISYLPHALRSALSSLRQGGTPKPDLVCADSLLEIYASVYYGSRPKSYRSSFDS